MIRFACPGCKKVLKAPETKTGVRVNCPKCGRPLEVPPVSSVPPRRRTLLGSLLSPFTRPEPAVPIPPEPGPPPEPPLDNLETVATDAPSPRPQRRRRARRYDEWGRPRRYRPNAPGVASLLATLWFIITLAVIRLETMRPGTRNVAWAGAMDGVLILIPGFLTCGLLSLSLYSWEKQGLGGRLTTIFAAVLLIPSLACCRFL